MLVSSTLSSSNRALTDASEVEKFGIICIGVSHFTKPSPGIITMSSPGGDSSPGTLDAFLCDHHRLSSHLLILLPDLTAVSLYHSTEQCSGHWIFWTYGYCAPQRGTLHVPKFRSASTDAESYTVTADQQQPWLNRLDFWADRSCAAQQWGKDTLVIHQGINQLFLKGQAIKSMSIWIFILLCSS